MSGLLNHIKEKSAKRRKLLAQEVTTSIIIVSFALAISVFF